MSANTVPYRSGLPVGRGGFASVLRAEWTKFRTVRGWVLGAITLAASIVLFAWLGTFRHQNDVCNSTSPGSCQAAHPRVPIGPGGEAVTDTYFLVHRTLAGSGSITVRVSSLSGLLQTGSGNGVSQSDLAGTPGPLQPWAKAGLIVTASTHPGAVYAAVMLTGAHGMRLQYDYTHDTAGHSAQSSPAARWLRLTRSGDTLTGYESPDGTHWTRIGSAHLAGLPASVQGGLFVTSPQTSPSQQLLADGRAGGQATGATARFDRVTLQGQWPAQSWNGRNVGAHSETPSLTSGGYRPFDGGFTVSGSGDIAPAVGLPSAFTDQQPLTGVFVGLIVLIVLATLFITTEYRRGLIRTTLTASPRRGRVLAAKALVIATVTFLAGAAAVAIAIPLGDHILRSNGNYVYPTSTLTELRVILGTGALLALTAVLALAVGTALRRSAGAVTAAIVLIVLPYILAIASALPTGVSQWLLRITPAAAFAVQQTLPQYHQVNYAYAPSAGFYPLAPGLGLAVLGAYALIALLIARRLLNRRDV